MGAMAVESLNPAAAERAREEVARMLRVEGNLRRTRSDHQRVMDKVFRRKRFFGYAERGTAPKYPEWAAEVLGDENEAVPPATRWESDQEDPVVGEDCWLWGSSVTCHPAPRMPESVPVFDFRAEDLAALHDWLAAEPPERPTVQPKVKFRAHAGHMARVEACLREYGEPLTMAEVITLTELPKTQVWRALRALEDAHVAVRKPDPTQSGPGRRRVVWSVTA